MFFFNRKKFSTSIRKVSSLFMELEQRKKEWVNSAAMPVNCPEILYSHVNGICSCYIFMTKLLPVPVSQ